MSEDVLFSRKGHLGLITLNRPGALNALSHTMIRSLYEILSRAQLDDDILAVVIQSSNQKAFCAGGDVRSLYAQKEKSVAEKMPFFEDEYGLNQLIYHYTKPYIALMEGITMGGGVGVSLHGSHPVASTTFTFAMPETAIGLFPDIGSSFLLSRCPGKLGLYLGLTGNRLNASEAYMAGLVKYVVDSSHFDTIVEQLSVIQRSPNTHSLVDQVISQFVEPVDTHVLDNLLSQVDRIFKQSDMATIMQRLEGSTEPFEVALFTTLQKKSPLSLCVTFEQLLKAAHLTFDECINMDTTLVRHFISAPDFYEGVRALLIDKDQMPKWHPENLSYVTPALVSSYFLS